MTKINSIITVFLLFCAHYSFASGDDYPNLITVVGTGQVSKTPDKIVVTLGVSLRNTYVNKLRQEVDTRSSNIIAYLKKQGIAVVDIQTSYVSIQPFYPYDPSNYDPKPQYYTASKTLTFILRKISKYDQVIEGVFDAGANSIDNIQFQVDDVEAKRQEARKLAANNAKEIAKVLAKELGVSVGKVFSITDQSGGSYYPQYVAYDVGYANKAASAGPSIAGGVVNVNANVEVKFYIDYGKYY